MGQLPKILLWLAAALVTFFALAAVALFLFFDPNDFRENISAAVKKNTGRELVIEGDITLDLFPWLAVDVGNTSLGDSEGFGDEPFASFDSAQFSVRLLPLLLSQEVVIGTAEIDTLMLNLKVDERGRSNWSDLVPDDSEAESDAATDSSGEIDISGIRILNSTIRYSNAESNETVVIDNANISVGHVSDDGSPVPFDGGLNFDVKPANLSGNVTVDAVLAYDAEKGVATISDIAVDGTIEGVASIPTTMSLGTKSVEVAMNEYQVTVQAVDLTALDMHVRADVQPFSYEDRITPVATLAIDAFSPRSVMSLFGVEPPVTADPSALSKVVVDATAQLTTSAIELRDVTIVVDDTTFTGSMSAPRSETGTFQLDLAGDSIDLNRYMEPASDTDTASETDTAEIEIPDDLIRSLNARGEFTMQSATMGGIVFENAKLGLNAGSGKMRLFPVSADLFGGAYNGDVNINVAGATPVLSVNEKIEGVDLAQLAKAMFGQENVTGTITGAFRLSGEGRNMELIQRDLAGNMSFELSDGAYEGTDIWYELRRARAALKGEEAPEPVLPARTEFSTVKATGVVTDGVMRNDDLFAELPFMRITGGGRVNLVEATVNYGLTARVLERPEFLEGATDAELDEFTEAVIPLKITGPLASPSVKPDVEKLLRQRVEEEIKDKLEDKLKDLFKR